MAATELIWVNVYKTTRHYGGPEEGGWWYNREDLEMATCFHKGEDHEIINAEKFRLERIWKSQNRGNIYSSRGGVEYWVAVENEKGKSEKTERPVYE